MFTLLLLACPAEDTGLEDTGPEPAVTYLFSFAAIADPHIVSDLEHEQRLTAAVDWINAATAEQDIALVLVLGDIGWGVGLETSYTLLEGFAMPYVPIIGDNEVHAGDAEDFHTVFAPQWAELAATFDDYRQASMPVYNPEWDTESWFTNFAFSHQGVTFMGMDWGSRDSDSLYGETADLQDFDGGTYPWFKEQLQGLGDPPRESVIMGSHHAMHLSPGSFHTAEIEELEGWAGAYGDDLSMSLAGHYHLDLDETLEVGGWDVHVLDATWDDEVTVMVVDVYGNGARFEYEAERILVDW